VGYAPSTRTVGRLGSEILAPRLLAEISGPKFMGPSQILVL
jgi:hypothetical protein